MARDQYAPGAADSDAALMLAVQRGDRDAFVKLFESYGPRLLSYVDRYIHDRAVAEEIVQEVFLKMYSTRKRYEVQSRFSTWLYRIATNAALNWLRDHKHRQQDEPFEDNAVRDNPASQPVDALFEARQLEQLVCRTIDSLPPNQRAALSLTRFAGCSYKETAEILELSESSVKSLVFRATDAIRRTIEENENRGAKRPHPLRLVKR